MCVLKLLQASGDDRHLVNLVSVAAAGQIVDRRIQTLQNRAVSIEAAQTLRNLIANVARVDVREDEGVCIACNLGTRCFELADFRSNRCVKL